MRAAGFLKEQFIEIGSLMIRNPVRSLINVEIGLTLVKCGWMAKAWLDK